MCIRDTFDKVQESVRIPFLHIADVTAQKIKDRGLKRVGLLGTKYTMEEDFYKERLTKLHGLEVVIPEAQDRLTIHDILFRHIRTGKIEKSMTDAFRDIIDRLSGKGVEGIILGCTEIPLFVKQEDFQIPLFDTTMIHARAAVEFALAENL